MLIINLESKVCKSIRVYFATAKKNVLGKLELFKVLILVIIKTPVLKAYLCLYVKNAWTWI